MRQPTIIVAAALAFLIPATVASTGESRPPEPIVIKLDIPTPQDSAGGLIVADVLGDWREEILVLYGDESHIYQNPAHNPQPDQKRPWEDRNYPRLKQVHNYDSP